MNILIIAPMYWPDGSGATRLLRGYAEGLTGLGHHVEVWTSDAAENHYLYFPWARRIKSREEIHAGVVIRRFPVWHPQHKARTFGKWERMPFPGSGFMFDSPHVFSRSMYIQARIKRPQADIILGGYLPFTSFIHTGAILARRLHRPFAILPLLHIGEPGDETLLASFGRPRQRMIINRADLLLANTEVEARALNRWGVDRNKIAIVGAGIDESLVKGGNGRRFKRRHGLKNQIVFQISTQTHDKGSHHLVEAMKQVRGAGIIADLVLIGKVLPDFDEYLANQPKEVLEFVYCLGHVSENEKRDLIAAGDVMAMPSRAESFGIAFLEAWLYSKPVIGCYAGSLPALIEDGTDGLLVPFADVHMLAESLTKLLRDGSLRLNMGDAGRVKLLRSYLWNRKISILEQELRSLLNGGV